MFFWGQKRPQDLLLRLRILELEGYAGEHLFVDLQHSQKQLAHWAVEVMAEFYACVFNGSLMCNSWTQYYTNDLTDEHQCTRLNFNRNLSEMMMNSGMRHFF